MKGGGLLDSWLFFLVNEASEEVSGRPPEPISENSKVLD